jgi:hypothetical protein
MDFRYYFKITEILKRLNLHFRLNDSMLNGDTVN